MQNNITVETVKATDAVTGVKSEWPLDEVRCNGHRIGFVDHREGATLRFERVLTKSTGDEVRNQVAELRKAAGKPAIAEGWVCPPHPDEVRKYIRQEQEAAGETEEEDNDDE